MSILFPAFSAGLHMLVEEGKLNLGQAGPRLPVFRRFSSYQRPAPTNTVTLTLARIMLAQPATGSDAARFNLVQARLFLPRRLFEKPEGKNLDPQMNPCANFPLQHNLIVRNAPAPGPLGNTSSKLKSIETWSRSFCSKKIFTPTSGHEHDHLHHLRPDIDGSQQASPTAACIQGESATFFSFELYNKIPLTMKNNEKEQPKAFAPAGGPIHFSRISMSWSHWLNAPE